MPRQPSPSMPWPRPSRVRIIGRRDWPERRRPLKGATGTLERPAEVQDELLPGHDLTRLDAPGEDLEDEGHWEPWLGSLDSPCQTCWGCGAADDREAG